MRQIEAAMMFMTADLGEACTGGGYMLRKPRTLKRGWRDVLDPGGLIIYSLHFAGSGWGRSLHARSMAPKRAGVPRRKTSSRSTVRP